jgi:hypothetical protein
MMAWAAPVEEAAAVVVGVATAGSRPILLTAMHAARAASVARRTCDTISVATGFMVSIRSSPDLQRLDGIYSNERVNTREV